MSFHDVQFPSDISYGSTGGPEFSTDVVVLHSGYEQRNQNWQQPRAKYNAVHGVKTLVQLEKLLAFFRARKGRTYAFRYKDWADHQLKAQLVGAGDGTQTTFQIVKQYGENDYIETRIITKPVAGSVVVYVDDVEQMLGVTVNADTGLITFDVAPSTGASVKVDAHFDVPVRFDTDAIAYEMQEHGVFSVNDIPMVEIRI